MPSVALAQTFGYFGENGPSHWGTLSPDWVACGTGTIQSPVDFGKLAPHHPRWRKLDIDYDPNTTGEIFNNGHTIEVETEGINTLTLDDVPYELVQFHFHTASEHRVDRPRLRHGTASGAPSCGRLECSDWGVLKRGRTSGALAPIFAALPDDLDVHHPIAASFNPAALLPQLRAHYRYLGSLMMPPCTEGVKWVVMSEPITVSDEDMAQFAERIHFNARPVQREARPSHGGGH